MPMYLVFIRVFLSVEPWFRLKTYRKGAPFYNASAFRPCGRDLVEFLKSTGWAFCVKLTMKLYFRMARQPLRILKRRDAATHRYDPLGLVTRMPQRITLSLLKR